MSRSSFLSNQIGRLYRESVIYRSLGRIRLLGRSPFDDGVKGLSRMPLAMFYYNLRAISLGLGLCFLTVLSLFAVTLPINREVVVTISVLGCFWLIEVFTTLLLHRSFRSQLDEWTASLVRDRVPPLMGSYFLLDSALILSLMVVGKIFDLNFGAFSFLLLANVITYATSIGSGGTARKTHFAALLLSLVAITVLLISGLNMRVVEPRWFHMALNAGPLIFMSIVTVLSVSMVSWLRGVENSLNQRRLELLGIYEAMLSDLTVRTSGDEMKETEVMYSERRLWDRCTEILKHLCSIGEPFWYNSACLWLVKDHQDRGRVFLPGPSANFKEVSKYREGIPNPTGLLNFDRLILSPSVKNSLDSGQIPIRQNLDAPAAFVPLYEGGRLFGVLALYGTEGGSPILDREDAFLLALSSILSNSMQQWEWRHRALLYQEMDDLFESRSLDEMFPRAAKILKKYIQAAGCLIIFRPDPTGSKMEVVAGDGFNTSIVGHGFYEVGRGETGRCAALGQSVRFDSVQSHLNRFGGERLDELERAIGEKVASWLSVPIGSHGQNFGVIKFLNSGFPCAWFTSRDQELAEGLALRLRVIIQRFLYVREIEEANREAQRAVETAQVSAADAHAAQQQAEQTALHRQEDLMVITHQLQGPLVSINAAITYLQRNVPRGSRQFTELDHIHALVEDALALCFGTFMTFAREVGREMSHRADEIDAPAELRMLCERLMKTNARPDLNFAFKQEAGFPTLRMDRSVFTSVFYSLIHNAMKYAERESRVTLECGFERATGKAVLKLKSYGLPIQPSEREKIFEKYTRGSIVTRTGRSYTGVGLGLWVARELMRASGGDLTVELSSSHPELSVFIVHVAEEASKHTNRP